MIRWEGEIAESPAPPKRPDGKTPKFLRWVGKVASRPETRCAWCGETMIRARFSDEVSHGICGGCADSWHYEMEA